jgi:two-component system sensor histidine kinase DesK
VSDRLARQGPGALRYVWLIYLASLAFQPIFDSDAGAGDWLAAVVLAAVFVPIYLATSRARSDRQVLALIAAMVVLAVAGSLVNSGAAVFVIYGAALAARLEPVRRAVLVIVGLVGAVVLMFVISPVPFPYRLATFAPALIFTVVIGAASLVEAERGRAHRRLLLADEEIERLAALAERARIARDLHDLLGHTLSVIVVKAELAGKLLALDAQRAVPEVADIERIAREALTQVRTAVTGYRTSGLEAELTGARRALGAAQVEVEIEAEVPALPAELESALALAVRESVTNIVRHAHARHAEIHVGAVGGTVVLVVRDDGRGARAPEGSGLMGMRERISALHGSVDVDAAEGTQVRVVVPLPAPGPMDVAVRSGELPEGLAADGAGSGP